MSEIVSVPYVIEDFEVGDGVWRFNSKLTTVLFGIVTVTEKDYVYVSGDDGIMHTVPISAFGKRNRKGEAWGKMVDSSLLHPGAVLSRVRDGKRVFHKVVVFRNYSSYQMGKLGLTQDLTKTYSETDWYQFTNQYTLDKILLGWELEA